MSEAPLMNDEAARSPTGEILDQATSQPKAETPPSDGSTTTPPTSTETPTSTEPKTPATDKPAVPEAYEFKAPDGYTLDPKLIETVTPIFKELGLDQAAAQKLFDVHTQALIDAAKAPQTTYETTRREWQAAVLADADIKAAATDGKTGIDAVKIDIGRALNALGDPKLTTDFKAAMDLTGAGDNPAFVKAMWKLSQMIGEGKHVTGANPSPEGQRAPGSPAKPSPAKAMYPNNP